MTVKLRKIVNFLKVILPKEIADRIRVSESDTPHVIPNADCARQIPFDRDFESAMRAFGRTRKKFRNALQVLAK